MLGCIWVRKKSLTSLTDECSPGLNADSHFHLCQFDKSGTTKTYVRAWITYQGCDFFAELDDTSWILEDYLLNFLCSFLQYNSCRHDILLSLYSINILFFYVLSLDNQRNSAESPGPWHLSVSVTHRASLRVTSTWVPGTPMLLARTFREKIFCFNLLIQLFIN